MSEEDDSLIPRLKQQSGYRSSIIGHQRYRTVGQALNSTVFWNNLNRKIAKAFKALGKMLRTLGEV